MSDTKSTAAKDVDDDDDENVEGYDYIFGFGSIMNTSTHASWQTTATTTTQAAAAAPLAGQVAILHKTPYRRCWNFRSSTGFTALGLMTTSDRSSENGENGDDDDDETQNKMNGVLFRIPHSSLADFDRREVGYDRVALRRDQIELIVPPNESGDHDCNSSSGSGSNHKRASFEIKGKERLWIYVPQEKYCALPDKHYPILQSYVDTVLQGCLDWGGEQMARDFITTTFDWSKSYYLNDTPHSRRPWLHRGQDYRLMDDLLQEYSDITHVDQARRHPEDFAAHRVVSDAAALLLHSSGKDALRGAWSLPQRNPVFVGRSAELQEIQNRLQLQQQMSSSSSSTATNTNTTIATLQVAGMGGVGKTQLVAEYCHLHVHDYYGLVLWLRASSAESVAAGYRQFMADCILHTTTTTTSNSTTSSSTSTTAMEDVKEMDTNDIVAEVKARLFRSKVPWLIVFDNLEDFELLPKFVPNGGTIQGHHVIVTTRLLHAPHAPHHHAAVGMTSTIEAQLTNNGQSQTQPQLHYDTMILQCFRPEESVQLLCRAGFADRLCGSSGEDRVQHEQAAKDLAERLGHLPLALGMAAAYMHQCDVDCCEYLTRYVMAASSSSLTSKNKTHHPRGDGSSSLNMLGHEAVSSSLSLSLQAIQKENPLAWEMLRLLSWLGPDQITKKLVRSLLVAKQQHEHEEQERRIVKQQQREQLGEKKNANAAASSSPSSLMLVGGVAFASTAAATVAMLSLSTTRSSRPAGAWQMGVVLGAVALVSVSTSLTALLMAQSTQQKSRQQRQPPPRPSSSFERSLSDPQVMMLARNKSFSGDVYQQTDHIWKLLKSFSLLQVKEGKASMHRLLGQFLRLSQNDDSDVVHFNLCVCFKAILAIWSFKPERVDTWNESTFLLEHVKTLIAHAIEHEIYRVDVAVLAKEAGVFSAMALNRFEEAQVAIEQSLYILDAMQNQDSSHGWVIDNVDQQDARGSALHELGRVLRYQGHFIQAEKALLKALDIHNGLANMISDASPRVASTLHELGVLEVKKHNLDQATTFLDQALDLRRRSALLESSSHGSAAAATIEADCASTLHQLAAVEVARKPPALDKAEALLKEALGLNMQIGQRAATLKQLARVSIRRGEFDVADSSLAQALELYVELYGEQTLHINVAAVRFQQGALAFQCDQLDEAWVHFSECLRARRHVYEFSQGNHLEVSSVMHELGCVAFAQKRIPKAREMLLAEKAILDQLFDSTSSPQQRQRLLQARLTNLTWLRKCAQESGDDEESRRLAAERSELKRKQQSQSSQPPSSTTQGSQRRADPRALSLQQETMRSRIIARQYALSKSAKARESQRKKLESALVSLKKAMDRMSDVEDDDDDMRDAAESFYQVMSRVVSKEISNDDGDVSKRRSAILKACDDLRDVLRDLGLQVNDSVRKRYM